MFVSHHYQAFSPVWKSAILHWEESGWNLNVLSATFYFIFFVVKFYGKAFIEISSAVHLSSISLRGSSSLAAFLGWSRYHCPSSHPLVQCHQRTASLRMFWETDGGCFHFYPLFLKKWRELRNWHFKNWWVRLRMACGEEWSDEWANGETRETRLDVQWKSPNLTAFWVCEWKLRVPRAPSHTRTFTN